MITVSDDLRVRFLEACDLLAQARLDARRKDTPTNRAAVVECRELIDTVLDVYLGSAEFLPSPAAALFPPAGRHAGPSGSGSP